MTYPRLALALFAAGSLLGCKADAFCLDCGPTAGDGSDTGDGGGFGNADGGAMMLGDAAIFGDGGNIVPGCMPLSAGEACNEIDDDCDGKVDEDFDLQTSIYHCGGCDRVCEIENGTAECKGGSCRATDCLDGFASLDDEMGCEYRCPVFPAQAEECNALDDDCDGTVDEELVDPPANLCRKTAGTPCADVIPICDRRGDVTAWFCDYPSAVEFDPSVANGIAIEEMRCDGADGDCDGVVDDPWPDLGTPCDDGGKGACADRGAIACDPDNAAAVLCDLAVLPDPVPGAGPEAPELCNNVDDDCDGIVDNSDPSDPKRVIDDMVHVVHAASDFYMFRYEASRPDAVAEDAGIGDARACSKPAALPWTYVSFAAAERACAASGHRLCTATEWRIACEAGTSNRYPYGDSYEGATCNGANRDAIAGGEIDNQVAPTGALASCVSADDVHDLSGNVKEWTSDMRGTSGAPNNTPIYVVRGGSFESPELGLTCQTDLSQATSDTTLPGLGFRCCNDDAPTTP